MLEWTMRVLGEEPQNIKVVAKTGKNDDRCG
jgi:hypothetical protein